MESLISYQSSDSEADHSHSSLPPPPPDLLTDASCDHAVAPPSLPPVEPICVSSNFDSFLVHVHIPVKHPQLDAFVKNLMGQARLAMVGQPIKAALTAVPHLHVSLSRATTMPSRDIHSLVHALRVHISRIAPAPIHICRAVRAFISGNGHRVYIAAPAIAVAPDGDDVKNKFDDVLLRLIDAVNAAFELCNLPPHFTTPQPHMSFAWTENLNIEPVFNALQSEYAPSMLTKTENIGIDVNTVVCDIGKSRYTFTLRKPKS